jgi:hypothetical protein
MLYHQNMLAQVNAGSRRLAASHIFSPLTRRFDCRHSMTSIWSRNSQPLATMPCSRGVSPVMKLAWTLHVTAGVTVLSGAMAPARASAESRGVRAPRWRGVSPTTIIARIDFKSILPKGRSRAFATGRACHPINPRELFTSAQPSCQTLE